MPQALCRLRRCLGGSVQIHCFCPLQDRKLTGEMQDEMGQGAPPEYHAIRPANKVLNEWE